MIIPCDKYVLGTRYGTKGSIWKCGWHSGLDLLSANYGGDGLVYPLYAGRIGKVGQSSAYGNFVQVMHDDGYVTLYAHLRQVLVRQNMRVDEDTVLGYEGMTGNATGKHLHIEVHQGKYSYPAAINPLEFIKRGMENGEMEKNIKINLNGSRKVIAAIVKDGHNYVKLQDLRDEKILIGYDDEEKMPVVAVRQGM